MQTRKTIAAAFLLPIFLIANNVAAESEQQRTLQKLSDSWTQASVGSDGSTQKDHYLSALRQVDTALVDFKEDPDVLAWAGIIEASYAGTLKGMAALKHAKKAKKLLSSAMDKNPEALDGGARSTLGVLYYKVPPWPIGFGNKKKAEAMLKESSISHPESLNAQYFYAEYLLEQKRYVEAKLIFERAQGIPIRPNHKRVDSARITKIERYLANLN